MNYDNPAARLLVLLEEGRKVAAERVCREVWEGLLGAKNDAPLLMSRLGKAMELPQAVVTTLRELDISVNKSVRHWQTQVNTAFFAQNLLGQWGTFKTHIDDHTIAYLEVTSELIESKAKTVPLSSDTVEDLRKRIVALLDEVITSDAPDGVKKYLVRSLRKLVVSIEEYRLTGAVPLLDAVDTTFGHMAGDLEYRSFLTSTELGSRVLETLQAAANVVAVTVGLPQLTLAIALLSN